MAQEAAPQGEGEGDTVKAGIAIKRLKLQGLLQIQGGENNFRDVFLTQRSREVIENKGSRPQNEAETN